MVRICVIGNSHVAALKLGWDQLGAVAGVNVTFFGSQKDTLDELRADGRRLIPQSDSVRRKFAMTSGGCTEISVDEYDVFVIHGLSLSFHSVVNQFVRNGNARDVSFVDVKSVLDKSIAVKVGRMLKNLDRPVLLSSQPFASELSIEGGKRNQWVGLVDENGVPTSDALKILRLYKEYLRRHEVIEQPIETVAREFLTRVDYAIDSVRLSKNMTVKHPDADLNHMNAKYGALVMEAIVARIVEGEPRWSSISPLGDEEDSKSVKGKKHPYSALPDRCFWRRTVSKQSPLDIQDWYRKKFDISSAKISTAGSCFAQHIGRRLKRNGFIYMDAELPPASLSAAEYMDYGYGMYSARYGNIYTTRQLRQLLERALGDFSPKDVAWVKDGGYVDPFRPTIQPASFGSIEEVVDARQQHLGAVRALFEQTDVFVFTLGLTETWEATEDGAVFPVAPGVSGGVFDSGKYRFVNLGFKDVMEDMRKFIAMARQLNPGMKFIFTVSPVPLMATASNHQVVTATMYSKSVLRAVAGQLADNRAYIDYFPSYEIVSSHVMGNQFYDQDMRSVTERGVDHVMAQFFAEHRPPLMSSPDSSSGSDGDDEVVCDEELLAAFGTDAGL